MQRFAVALLAFLAVLALVLPSEARITNAERFARHQPPLPPSRRTPTAGAKRHYPSGTPSSGSGSGSGSGSWGSGHGNGNGWGSGSGSGSNQGHVQCRDGSGSVLGYLQNDPVRGPNHIRSSPSAVDLTVELSAGNLQALDALFPAPFFIGGSSLGGILAADLNIFVPLSNVADISPTTWQFDATSQHLIPQWKKLDGTTFEPFVVYDVVEDSIAFVTDVEQYESAHPTGNFVVVDFFLV